MYTLSSQVPFTQGRYLGDATSLSVHKAGPSRPCGGKGSTTQRAGTALQGRQVQAGLSVICTPTGIMSWGRPVLPWRHSPPENSGAGSACVPLSVRAPFPAGGGRWGTSWAPPPRPLRPPFLPQLPGLCTRRPPFCTFLFPGSEGEGTREQGCSVCSRGLLSKINTRSSHLHGGGRPRVAAGAWSP